MDHGSRQLSGPMRVEIGQFIGDALAKPRCDIVQMLSAFVRQIMPARDVERIAPFAVEALCRPMQLPERRACCLGLCSGGFSDGNAGQKFDQAGRPAAQLLQPLALPVSDEAGDEATARAQMIEQVHEEGKVGLIHPLFIESEDVAVAISVGAGGFQQVIAVLHPFGDALGRYQPPGIIAGEESVNLFGGDMGIDCHDLMPLPARGAA